MCKNKEESLRKRMTGRLVTDEQQFSLKRLSGLSVTSDIEARLSLFSGFISSGFISSGK